MGVKSPTGSLHAVKLYPRESCSCSFSQRCCHIMAVMIAVGLPLFPESMKAKKARKSRTVPTKYIRPPDQIAQTAYIDYEITDQTIVNQPAVIPMIISSDGSDNYVPVTMDEIRSDQILAYQAS